MVMHISRYFSIDCINSNSSLGQDEESYWYADTKPPNDPHRKQALDILDGIIKQWVSEVSIYFKDSLWLENN